MEELIILPILFFIAFTDMGNDNFDWVNVEPQKCISGESKTGHAFTLNGKIYFKQRNHDGSVGEVCNKS
tara:strand:+ start:2312 stop:2518 length:207 start_codon:yes stop_codon:yes gene_type:complete